MSVTVTPQVTSRVHAGKTGSKKPRWIRLKEVLPHAWTVIRPRVPAMALGIVFLAVSRLTSLVLPASARVFVDDVLARGERGRLPELGMWLGLSVIAQVASSYALFRLLTLPTIQLVAELRVRAIAHLLRLRVQFFDSQRTGELLPRVLSDVESLRLLFGSGFVEFVGSVLFAAFSAAYMWSISPRLTFVAIATFIAFSSLLGWAFWGLSPVYSQRARLLAEATGQLSEALSGIRVVKLFRAEEREMRDLTDAVHAMRDNAVTMAVHNRVFAVVSSVITGALGLSLMALASEEIQTGQLTLGGLTTFVLLLGFLSGPVYMMMALAAQFADALISIERLQEVMAEPPEPFEGVAPSRPRAEVEAAIELRDVHFSYPQGSPVLKGVGFRIEPGTSLALVGPSGAGKSTVVSLLARFYEPQQGEILIDGLESRSFPLGQYRSLLGVVPQDVFLFDASVRDNVRVALPDAPDADVEAACLAAHVDDFVRQLKDDYDTIVGERGVRLSGGQKQRLAIARALLARPKIVILDEATSSLDAESEALIQESLRHLMKDRTTVVVAHRLSTVRQCHQILVLQGGRVEARGSHDELMVSSDWYRSSVTRQTESTRSDVWI